MTAVAVRRPDLARPLLAAVGLAAAVGLRWEVATSTNLDPVLVGLLFGTCLVSIAGLGGWRPGPLRTRTVLVGLAGGGALVAVTAGVRLVGGFAVGAGSVSGEFALAPWAIATCLVAAGEEVVLRGVLFDALAARSGPAAAVGATSVVFALMHVPLYGWQVIPLDLGAGLWFAGLRLLTGGAAAPAIAHAVADVATYWL